MKLDMKGIGGLLLGLLLINVFAIFWAKFLFTYGSIKIEEKVVPGLDDRKFVEFSIKNESLLVLELNESKTEAVAIKYESERDETQIYYNIANGNLHVSRGEDEAYYQSDDMLPILYRREGSLFKIDPSIQDIWVPAKSKP